MIKRLLLLLLPALLALLGCAGAPEAERPEHAPAPRADSLQASPEHREEAAVLAPAPKPEEEARRVLAAAARRRAYASRRGAPMVEEKPSGEESAPEEAAPEAGRLSQPQPRPTPAPSPAPLAPPPKIKAAASFDEAKSQAENLIKELEKRKRAKEAPPAGAQPESAKAKGAPEAEVALKYQKLLDAPGTLEERKPEILSRLAEISFEEESASLRSAYEMGTYVNIKEGQRYPRSIRYYGAIANSYPNSPQALTAFYNLGFLYSEERMLKEAAAAYGEVLKRDPASPYAPEINMRLAEAAFSEGHYREAANRYELVIASPRADYRDKANYKLGWCHYKLEDYQSAIKVFNRILDRPEGAAHDLVIETIDIIGKCLVERGGAPAVADYLSRVDTATIYGDLIYQKVGSILADRSRFEEAVAAFERAVASYPETDVALTVEKGILAALGALRDTERINLRRRKWVDLYAPGTPWDRANGELYSSQRDQLLEEGVRLAAIYRHARAQRGEGGLPQALELYEIYEKLYGDQTAEGYEMSFARAQALKEAGRLAEAELLYGKVAHHPSRSSHREEAGYKRIEALDALRQRDASYLPSFVEAHEDYIALNPNSPLVPQLIFSVGEIEFASERFAQARAAFARVADQFPGDRLAPGAIDRLSRAYFREGKYADAEREGRRALALGLPRTTGEEVGKLISFCVFKEAEEHEAAGRFGEAAADFFRLADEFPTTEAAQVALYRGAEGLRKSGREKEAAEVYAKLAAVYANSAYAASALTLSSEILSALGDWKGVADNYEKLYRMKPGASDAQANLYKAALAREKSGDEARTMALFEEYAAKNPESPRLAQIYHSLASMREKAGDEKEARDWFEKTWKLPDTPEGAPYRARAALRLAEWEYEAFKAVALKGNLKKAFAEKEARLDKALTRLADVAAFPYPETLPASLYRAAEAFEVMKTAILESERPKGLNAEELEQYQFLLEEKAAPLEEKAIDLYRRGVAASRRAGIRNEWVYRMYGRLELLMPYNYQRAEQTVWAWVEPEYPGTGWKREARR